MEEPRRSVVVLTGPTASGKTKIAIDIAKKVSGEIIVADSVQIYRDFNIGSAKPDEKEQAGVPHHLLSSVEPTTDFDVGQFCKLAGEKITEITNRGKLPIIVGGTGLYIRALLCGLVSTEGVSEKTKKLIAQRIDGLQQRDEILKVLYNWLEEIDSVTASSLHPNDLSRIRRALEISLEHGVSIEELRREHRNKGGIYRALVICLELPREELYREIDNRVERMFSNGFIEEVQSLRAQYPLTVRPFSSIGYRHVCQYLEEAIDFQTLAESLKRDTRHFAKRQLTWWRNQPQRLGWVEIQEGREREKNISDEIHQTIASFICFSGVFSKEGIAIFYTKALKLDVSRSGAKTIASQKSQTITT